MNQEIMILIEHLRGKVADISYMMLANGQALAQATGMGVTAVLLGHDAQELAGDLAAGILLYGDHPALEEFNPDAYLDVLADIIKKKPPRAVLLGHTAMGMDIAGGLSIRLGVPLVSQCRELCVEDNALKYVSQICGGKILAEGDVPKPTAIVTMVPGRFQPEQGKSDLSPEMISIMLPPLEKTRISLTQYIEPEVEEVDITKEPILIAVGRGLQNQNDLELVEELAGALGGAVCATRPLVDLGWLPTTRLVGKSGKSVKPRLYLALGISGAPEHVESITGSQTIIAVNTDPNAPIFDVAQYGVEADLMDIIEELNDLVLEKAF